MDEWIDDVYDPWFGYGLVNLYNETLFFARNRSRHWSTRIRTGWLNKIEEYSNDGGWGWDASKQNLEFNAVA